jgi:hypothetical protein
VQVMRATYRLNGPMQNGIALGAVVLNQRWRLTSETLPDATTFRPLSAGLIVIGMVSSGRRCSCAARRMARSPHARRNVASSASGRPRTQPNSVTLSVATSLPATTAVAAICRS